MVLSKITEKQELLSSALPGEQVGMRGEELVRE